LRFVGEYRVGCGYIKNVNVGWGQVVILSLLVVLAKDSFFYAWGDQLD